MTKIQGAAAASQYIPNYINNLTDADGDNNLYKVKLVFSPDELGVKGKRPERIALTEKQVESKIFQNYGFNPSNKVQMAMLELRFGGNKSPYSEIDWEKGKFVAQLNSKGQYEITGALRERTVEALEGRMIIAPTANENISDTVASRTGYDTARLKKTQIAKSLPKPDLTGLTPEQKELVADLGQVGLSIIGIFDPTGIADGADALISLGRGDYWGAGISALGIIPYLGDLAKIGKLPKLLKIVDKTVEMAKVDGKFAKVVEPLLKTLKNALDKLPIHKLPEWAKKPIEALKTKIDDFFKVAKVTLPKITFSSTQLQKKFKHAADFGITGNYNAANALKFQKAIENHIASPGMKVIQGTYRGNPVTHIYNPNTGINVMVERTGEFISGWKLNPAQAANVVNRGSL